MAKKFYAVKVGRVPGVYTTYEDAREQTNKFPMAELKAFNDRVEALAYISGSGVRQDTGATESQAAPGDAEAIRDQAKRALLAAQADTLAKEEELSRATGTEAATKQKALIDSWAAVNTKAEAYADAQVRAEGKEKDVLYLHGGAAFSTLLAAQRFSEGKVVYKCYLQEEIGKLITEAGRPFYTTHRDEFNTGENEDGETVRKVYIEGLCPQNGTPDAVGGIGVHFGDYHSWNVSERLPGALQTIQRAELAAALRAYEVIDAKSNGEKYEVYTDSAYVVGCFAGWASTWEERGWVNSDGTPVRNQDLVKALLKIRDRPSCRHVPLKKSKPNAILFHTYNANLLALVATRSNYLGEKKYCDCNFCVRSSFLKTTRYRCPNSKGFVAGLPQGIF